MRIGDLPTSKPLRAWLADPAVAQVALDPEGAWQDPAAVVGRLAGARPGDALAAAAPQAAADPAWLAAWRAADDAAAPARSRASLGDER